MGYDPNGPMGHQLHFNFSSIEIMMRHLLGLLIQLFCIPQLHVVGFVATRLSIGRESLSTQTCHGNTHYQGSYVSMMAKRTTDAGSTSSPSLSSQEEQVYALLKELSDSKYPFRIVVVGNGAILESTNLLGPTLKVSPSPATGANLATFASKDQSFEFHLVIGQVCHVTMIEKPSPVNQGKTLRLVRLLNDQDKSICSFILADESMEAEKWFQFLQTKYGTEMTVE
jgi:hypothetical protein